MNYFLIVALVALSSITMVCVLGMVIFWDLAARNRKVVGQAASKRRLRQLGGIAVGLATVLSAAFIALRYFTGT